MIALKLSCPFFAATRKTFTQFRMSIHSNNKIVAVCQMTSGEDKSENLKVCENLIKSAKSQNASVCTEFFHSSLSLKKLIMFMFSDGIPTRSL